VFFSPNLSRPTVGQCRAAGGAARERGRPADALAAGEGSRVVRRSFDVRGRDRSVTVIAFRDGVLACDSQARNPQNVRMGALPKIFDLERNGLVAISGYAPLGFALLKWVKEKLTGGASGPQPQAHDDEHNGCLVHFAPDGSITIYENGWSQPEAAGPYHAYAYGAELAMAAMWCGAGAVKAVECAIALSTECGGPIQTLRLNLGDRPAEMRASGQNDDRR
jgi:hypothetical protein